MVLYYGIASIAFFVGVSSNIATICDEEPLYTFLPDVRDCKAWYFCSLNGTIRGACSDQYLFNSKTRLCDWPQNVDCFQCTSNVGMQKISVERSCRKFIRCIGGIATQNACADGLQFNEFTGQCDLESAVQCESGFRCPDELPNNGSVFSIRDNRNCSVYYICIGDTHPIRQECNPELHFDPVTSLCTYPKYTDCPINENARDPGDGPGYGFNTETDATVPSYPTDATLPSIEHATQAPTRSLLDLSDEPSPVLSDEPSRVLSDEPSHDLSTKTQEKPFECPFDGVHGHQIECSEYYICADNMAHHMKCAEGLHFNVANLQCDFPENANCDFYNNI